MQNKFYFVPTLHTCKRNQSELGNKRAIGIQRWAGTLNCYHHYNVSTGLKNRNQRPRIAQRLPPLNGNPLNDKPMQRENSSMLKDSRRWGGLESHSLSCSSMLPACKFGTVRYRTPWFTNISFATVEKSYQVCTYSLSHLPCLGTVS